MTIRRGEDWGRPVTAPDPILVVSSDAEISERQRDEVMTVNAGDTWLALGRPSGPEPGQECRELGLDALEVTIARPDGSSLRLLAASTVEAGKWFRRGAYVAVLNNGFCRGLNLTPRSHPNDGRLEVFLLESGTPVLQRIMMRRRARSGSHLPHPGVTISSSEGFSYVRSGQRQRLTLDGHDIGAWTSFSVHCVPDHWRLLL